MQKTPSCTYTKNMGIKRKRQSLRLSLFSCGNTKNILGGIMQLLNNQNIEDIILTYSPPRVNIK